LQDAFISRFFAAETGKRKKGGLYEKKAGGLVAGIGF
jgi:hypothetical protein